MSLNPTSPDPRDVKISVKLLPDDSTASRAGAGAASGPARAALAAGGDDRVSSAANLPRQLSELPRDELDHLAEEYGLDATRYETNQLLVAAIHDRRAMIGAMDRDAMLDVIRWGRRPVTMNAGKDQIAQEIARIKSMKFAGLSQRGLVVLARMRGIDAADDQPVPTLVKRLKKQEGWIARLGRKRRSMVASLIAGFIGEEAATGQYQFLPPTGAGGSTAGPGPYESASFKQEIEEAGLLGGITNRLKKTADSYVNQKLDEIEARIDRKLDEIDRRLTEWRDKEIANRIRILKITLWASVIVGVVSLIYSYIVVYFFPTPRPPTVPPRSPIHQIDPR